MNIRNQAKLLALPLALAACEGTTEPLPRGALSHTEVTTATRRLSADVLPGLVGGLRALERSSALTDVSLPFAELPAEADVTSGVQELIDELLDQSSLESQSATELVYRVRPSAVCDGDTRCVQAFTAEPARVVARATGVDAVTFRLELGNARTSPLSAELERERVTARVDLAAARQALSLYASAFELDPADLPATAQGIIAITALASSVGLDLSGDVHLAGAIQGDAYDVALGNGHIELELDEAAHSLRSLSTLGALDVRFPLKWLATRTVCTEPVDPNAPWDCEDVIPAGQLGVRASALRYVASADADDDSLTIDDLSFGNAPVAITLDGAPQASLDLNASAGRAVDLGFRYLRQELEVVAVPSLDVLIDLPLAQLAEPLEIPAWLVGERVHARFDGAARPTLRFGAGTAEDVVARVVEGTVTLESGDATQPALVAQAAQCLGAREEVPEGATVIEALMLFTCE